MRIKEVKTKLKQRVCNRVTQTDAELHWKRSAPRSSITVFMCKFENKNLLKFPGEGLCLIFLLHFEKRDHFMSPTMMTSSQRCSTMLSSSGVSLHLSVSAPHRSNQKMASQ